MMRPQFFVLHARQIRAAQADAAQDIDFKEAHPVGVGDFFKRFRFKDAEVVDENIDGGEIASRAFLQPSRSQDRRQSRRAWRWATSSRIFASAASTDSSERPLMMTLTPSRARPVAMARPMPLVEPETRAILSASCRSIMPRSSHRVLRCQPFARSTKFFSSCRPTFWLFSG